MPRRRLEEPGEPGRLLRIERDRRLGFLAVPDAETGVLRLGEVNRDAEAAVAYVRVALEVLDDLRALRLAAMRTEPEVVLYLSPALATAAHVLVLCPRPSQVKPTAPRIASTGA